MFGLFFNKNFQARDGIKLLGRRIDKVILWPRLKKTKISHEANDIVTNKFTVQLSLVWFRVNYLKHHNVCACPHFALIFFKNFNLNPDISKLVTLYASVRHLSDKPI